MNINDDRVAWLKGGEARCAMMPRPIGHRWRLVLLGAPGVGKGAGGIVVPQSGRVSSFDWRRFQGGQMPRRRRTRSGIESPGPKYGAARWFRTKPSCPSCMSGFVACGARAVSSSTVSHGQWRRRRHSGQLLQLERIELNAVIDYELPLDKILARLGGRRTCAGCKAVFHLQWTPPPCRGTTTAAERFTSVKTTGPNPFVCGCRRMRRTRGRSSNSTRTAGCSSPFRPTPRRIIQRGPHRAGSQRTIWSTKRASAAKPASGAARERRTCRRFVPVKLAALIKFR